MPKDIKNNPRIIKLVANIGLSIEYWKKKLGKDHKESKEVQKLEWFREQIISGNSEAIFNENLADLQKELLEASKKSRGLGLDNKLGNLQRQWEIIRIVNDYCLDKPKMLYNTEEKIGARVQALKQRYINRSQPDLAEEVAKLVLVLEYRHQDIETLKQERDFLADRYQEFFGKRRSDVAKQNAEKSELFSPNNECLLQCIKEIEAAYKDFPRKIHYRRFCDLVVSRYPTKPFKQAGSLSGEEKLQTKELQAINRESNKNEKWAPTTMRDFFEGYIGRAITTLEK